MKFGPPTHIFMPTLKWATPIDDPNGMFDGGRLCNIELDQ